MDNHIGTFYIRIFREWFAERRIVSLVRRHYRIVDELQVIAAAGLVELGRLLALHLARTVVVDNLLFQLVGA